MAKPLRPKRGTTAKNDAFTGLASEITVDTDKHSIRVHDGVTAGGHALATDADLATVRATAESALPKSGGELTGTVVIDRADGHIYKKDASGRMLIRGGTSSGTDGASVYLSGKDAPTNPSVFQVRCADDTNDKSFICKPDGTMTWDGNDVITSAGGAMHGVFVYDATEEVIRKSNTNSRIIIRGGDAFESGGSLYLYGLNHSGGGMNGGFALYAHDGSQSKSFLGLPDGTLKWGGKAVDQINSCELQAEGGGYIRYESGLQICWGYGVKGTVSYPAPFLHYPAVVTGHWTSKATGGAAYMSWAGNPKTTGFVVNNIKIADASVFETDADYIAIGDWK